MQVSQFIKVVRRQVNDLGTDVAWSDATIMDALNEAVCHIAEVRPDLFETTVNVFLSGTDVLDPPEGYRRIIRVLDNTDPLDNSVILAPVETADADKQHIDGRFAYFRCARPVAEDRGGIATHTVEQAQPLGSGGSWRVVPAVPAGVQASLRVLAVPIPEHITSVNDTLPDAICAMLPAAKSYVMMRMFETDTESLAATDHAMRYQKQVAEFLGVTYRQQAARQSGWWMGEHGRGDERAAQ